MSAGGNMNHKSKLNIDNASVEDDVEAGTVKSPLIPSYRSETIMIPFNTSTFIRVYLIHSLPYLFMLVFPKTPELSSFFFWPMIKERGWDGLKWSWYLNHSFNMSFLVSFLIFVGLPNTNAFREDTYSDKYLPVGQLFAGSLVLPLVCYTLHRAAVAAKYATLSDAEYKSYLIPRSFDEELKKMMSLNLFSGWINNIEDYVLNFEINAAAARVGIECENVHFHIANPLQSISAYENFRHWQAFLLGKDSVADITHELHPSLVDVFEKISLDGAAAHAVDMFSQVTESKRHVENTKVVDINPSRLKSSYESAIEMEKTSVFKKTAEDLGSVFADQPAKTLSNKSKFKLLTRKAAQVDASTKKVSNYFYYRVSLKKVTFALFKWVMKIPSSKIIPTIINIVGITVAVLPGYTLLFRRLSPTLPIYVQILAYIYLFLTICILYQYYGVIMTFLNLCIRDSNRRYMEALLLKQMLRGSNLDLDGDLALSGWSKSQCAHVPDYIIRSQDGFDRTQIKFVSGRNPDIARMPRIFTDQSGKNNFIVWSYMRSMCRSFGMRHRWKLDVNMVLNFIFVSILMAVLLFYFLIQYSVAKGENFPGVIWGPLWRLPYENPFVVQTLLTFFVSTALFSYNIVLASFANEEYRLHKKTLLERMMRNEAEMAFLSEHNSDLKANENIKDAVKARVEKLDDLSVALEATLRNIKNTDTSTGLKIFGFEASFPLTAFFLTYASFWMSIFFSIYTLSSKYPQFNCEFLNADKSCGG